MKNTILAAKVTDLKRNKTYKLDVNVAKTGSDVDVIEMWMRDECVHILGFDLLPGEYRIENLDELVQAGKPFDEE